MHRTIIYNKLKFSHLKWILFIEVLCICMYSLLSCLFVCHTNAIINMSYTTMYIHLVRRSHFKLDKVRLVSLVLKMFSN